jgi:ubiquinone/menaquinone biosynthesis C-methylase UbiE
MPQNNKEIYLPGSVYQFSTLTDKFGIKEKSVLVMGAGSEDISKLFLKNKASSVIQIVEEEDSLLVSRLYLKDVKEISVRLMTFNNTDFSSERFDIIFAQASISNARRNKIVKEIIRILKPGGLLAVGEIVQLENNAPIFVRDLWQASGISPLLNNEVSDYYRERNFEILYEDDFSSILREFYQNSQQMLNKNVDKLSGQEKAYHKKFLNKLRHESNAYLNLGADKYMGFKILIMKKV